MLHDQQNIRKYIERKKSIYRLGMNQTLQVLRLFENIRKKMASMIFDVDGSCQ